MDEKWLAKLMRNCLLQYGYDMKSFPLNDSEWKQLREKILSAKINDEEMDMYEIVNDVFYEIYNEITLLALARSVIF